MSNTTALMSLGREDIWTDEGNNMGRQVAGQCGQETVARPGLERSKGCPRGKALEEIDMYSHNAST